MRTPQQLISDLLAAGYSQAQIADRSEVSQPTISRIQSGAHDPASSVLIKLTAFANEALGTHRTSSLRPVRVYHHVATPKEGGGYTYPREVLHELGLFHTFGQESTEGPTEVVHGMCAVIELPDGAVITPAAHLIQFLDIPEWKPLTEAGQVSVGEKLRFTIGDKAHYQRAKLVLNAGTDKEEVVYDKGRNFYFITSMVLSGTSTHKNVEVLTRSGSSHA